jgi:hypothetical protein
LSLIREVVVVLFVSQSASLGWLLFSTVWALVLLSQGSRRRNPFRRRLEQLLLLLVPRPATEARGGFAAFKEEARRSTAPGVFRGSARRWRAQLGAVYAQGYQVASETISPPAELAQSSELVREAVAALRAGRGGGGVALPTTDDPVVILAYGLGAWPSGADLTSLEDLLGELGVSHDVLRNRFESLLRTIPTANQNREFRELAGASFVLGASARIIEATVPPGSPPPGWSQHSGEAHEGTRLPTAPARP